MRPARSERQNLARLQRNGTDQPAELLRRVLQRGKFTCCFDCVQCSEGEISNQEVSPDRTSCEKCPENQWPNQKKEKCVEKSTEYLSYDNDPITVVLSTLSILLTIITSIILVIFILFRDTPIVKVNNRNLSFILLVSIMLSFLCTFLFLGHPVDITCMLRQTSFGIIFSVAVSAVLAKTIMVCIAFKATKPSSNWSKFVGVKIPNCVVFIGSFTMVIICISWLSIAPPFQEMNTHSYPGKIIIQCNEGSVIAFCTVLGYMGLLAAVSFIVAFLVRNLPDSFNEAKYITFSMLVFCNVWITFIPAYMSVMGKNTVIVEIFAIIASSAGILCCIFLPKCYIIVLRPNINTKKHLLKLNWSGLTEDRNVIQALGLQGYARESLQAPVDFTCWKNTDDQNSKRGIRHVSKVRDIRTTPSSKCSEDCVPGYRRVLQRGKFTCCFDCVQCSEGEISNQEDRTSCEKCPENQWPNQKKEKCVEKSTEYLSYDNDPITLVLSTLSILLTIITSIILVIFILFRDTPIVKVNNRNLSFILLVSIMLSFLCTFLFLGHPVDITCMLRQTSFGIIFSVAVSAVLAKTIMVCIAFKATKPSSNWSKFVGVKIPNCVVFIGSFTMVIICISWLSIAPPFQEMNTHSYPGKIIIQCNEGSVIAFCTVLGYMGFLAAVSFIVAFLVRNLPDSFNEAKYITFSMLVFCNVWITFIPAYMSVMGKNTVIVEIFAIIASSAGILCCIFLPKCYIIVLRPNINTKKHLLKLSN
ncbi:vomeronasal type-2 receptor 26-like [Pelobates cultripes]|uniref:Vomeronasal type-2 receptor 26-like n=1 Tax=Pelobates cultripes TaxID=61616 RepID=A0AAD1WCK8_PELCU|nr:vomeronasal type-2 receptor 26-like [Pelobates cultripes]